MKIIAVVAALALVCSGCGFLDSILLPGAPEVPGGPPTPPPIIRVVSPLSDAVPGYGGAIVGAVGLLAGLYQSIRKRQEEGKKISIMEGIDVVKENWDKVQNFPEVQKILREVAQKNGNAVAINKDLDALRAKGTI
jgi:hypothetical protein